MLDIDNKQNELIDFVKGLIASGVTQTEIGKKVNYSRSQINKFLEGGKVSNEFIESIVSLRNEYIEKNEVIESVHYKKSLKELDFILTKDAKNILGVCKATQDINGFSAILGNAGTGKTETIQRFVTNSNNAIYIRCNCLMSTGDILKAIAKACGTTLQSTSKSEIFNEIVEHLINNPKVLIFDEVDQIMPVKNVNKIETLRNLHDVVKEYGNSMILVGSLAIEHHLKRRNMYENYGQIDSRMDYTYKTQGLNEKEIVQILSEFNVNDSAKEEIVSLIIRTTKGGIRWLTKTINKCLDIANMDNGEITKDIVKDATAMMMI